MSSARARWIAYASLASPALVVALLSADARLRRADAADDAPALAAVAARLPTGDLALSGGARWLRAPSLEEPGAAFSDDPAIADPDPAGGAMAPPIEVWREEAERAGARLEVRR